MSTPKRKPGRPSKFTPQILAEICERLSNGEPMAQICRDDGMPGLRTVYDWMDAMPDVSAQIARAREQGFDAIAVDALRIADDGINDKQVDADGRVVVDHDVVQRSKLRVETRLKLLAKWDPKRYGDRQQVEHSGKIGLEDLVASASREAGDA